MQSWLRGVILCFIIQWGFCALAQKPIMHLPRGHSERITKILPSKDKKYLVSLSKKDGKIFVSHTAYRKILYEISDPKTIFKDIHVVQDSGQIAVAGVQKKTGKESFIFIISVMGNTSRR